MAWQTRNKSRYYYKTIYINGQYFNLYCGKGRQGKEFENMFNDLAKERRAARRRLSDPAAGPTADPPAD